MGAFDDLGADIAAILNDAEVTASITHTSVTVGAYNPATSAGTVTTASYTINGVPSVCRKELQTGIGVEAGDIELVVMAPEFTVAPTLKDKFTVRSQAYSVVAITWAEIGGALVAYTLQLRKA